MAIVGLLAFVTFAVIANVVHIVWTDIMDARREQADNPIFPSAGPIEGGGIRYQGFHDD